MEQIPKEDDDAAAPAPAPSGALQLGDDDFLPFKPSIASAGPLSPVTSSSKGDEDSSSSSGQGISRNRAGRASVNMGLRDMLQSQSSGSSGGNDEMFDLVMALAQAEMDREKEGKGSTPSDEMDVRH